ncbi:MAG: exosortase/archaeosortase family protein [Candidatus Symbiothrix sp.]|jgi:exosortase/archaeosortase family protein|nr:exosortase/archaeosortase family protein [Candidatus Symbiothrix sp.]
MREKLTIDKLKKQLRSQQSIIYFLLLLFLFHFSWKLVIDGDIDSEFMYVFGQNVTPGWVGSVCRGLTAVAGWFIHLFPNTQDLVIDSNRLYFPGGGPGIRIIWGCIGFKQLFIFCGIMIFYRLLPWRRYERNKLWYIPLGCVILTIYNIIRIGSLTMLTNGHPERFESLHDGIFRYIYYTIVFILWVIWEEKFVRNKMPIEHTV